MYFHTLRFNERTINNWFFSTGDCHLAVLHVTEDLSSNDKIDVPSMAPVAPASKAPLKDNVVFYTRGSGGWYRKPYEKPGCKIDFLAARILAIKHCKELSCGNVIWFWDTLGVRLQQGLSWVGLFEMTGNLHSIEWTHDNVERGLHLLWILRRDRSKKGGQTWKTGERPKQTASKDVRKCHISPRRHRELLQLRARSMAWRCEWWHVSTHTKTSYRTRDLDWIFTFCGKKVERKVQISFLKR